MFNHLLLKFVLFFLCGAIFTIIALEFIPGYKGPKVLGESTSIVLDDQLHETSGIKVQTIVQSLLNRVFPSLVANPAFEPLLQTTSDIKATTDEVRNLPRDQKSAICREICGE